MAKAGYRSGTCEVFRGMASPAVERLTRSWFAKPIAYMHLSALSNRRRWNRSPGIDRAVKDPADGPYTRASRIERLNTGDDGVYQGDVGLPPSLSIQVNVPLADFTGVGSRHLHVRSTKGRQDHRLRCSSDDVFCNREGIFLVWGRCPSSDLGSPIWLLSFG